MTIMSLDSLHGATEYMKWMQGPTMMKSGTTASRIRPPPYRVSALDLWISGLFLSSARSFLPSPLCSFHLIYFFKSHFIYPQLPLSFILFREMGIKSAMLCSITLTFLLSLLLIPSLLNRTSKLHPINRSGHHLTHQKQKPYPVSFAYLISASKGDVDRLIRLLTAIYHPANCYLLHLDREAEPQEHHHLYQSISSHPTFAQIRNVWIVQKSNLVTYRGPTMLTTTLHAMAILLRTCRWDWFINLSASDYPLITQDGK